MRWAGTVVLAMLVASVSRAERPSEEKKAATDIFIGIVGKVTPAEEPFRNDGVLTRYRVELRVQSVEKGNDFQKGDTAKLYWFHVTKRPSNAFPGAYGHKYEVRKNDLVRVYLMKREKDAYEVIYNPAGIEVLKKAGK